MLVWCCIMYQCSWVFQQFNKRNRCLLVPPRFWEKVTSNSTAGANQSCCIEVVVPIKSGSCSLHKDTVEEKWCMWDCAGSSSGRTKLITYMHCTALSIKHHQVHIWKCQWDLFLPSGTWILYIFFILQGLDFCFKKKKFYCIPVLYCPSNKTQRSSDLKVPVRLIFPKWNLNVVHIFYFTRAWFALFLTHTHTNRAKNES